MTRQQVFLRVHVGAWGAPIDTWRTDSALPGPPSGTCGAAIWLIRAAQLSTEGTAILIIRPAVLSLRQNVAQTGTNDYEGAQVF